MSNRKLLLLLALLGAAGCGARGLGELPSHTYALTDLVLIDGTGAPPVRDAVILVSDGRIGAVGKRGDVSLGREVPRVSLRGARVLPGFINAHVHGAYDSATLRRWLASGVTTVRDLGPLGATDFLRSRDALNRDPANARIVSATPLITKTGGYGGAWVDGADSARELVQGFIAAGADVIKVAVEDDLQGRRWPLIEPEELSAVVEAAHEGGRRVSAHVSHVRNLPLAVDAGVDDLAHMVVEPLPLETARAITARGIRWVPTLELWKGVSAKHGLDWIEVALANTGVFHRAGGRVALGTDYNGYSIPFDTGFPITEARLLLEAGLSPMDVIVAGTRNAAEVSGRLADLGTIERGKIADLLVVRGDPLGDISVLERPLLVIKGGERRGGP